MRILLLNNISGIGPSTNVPLKSEYTLLNSGQRDNLNTILREASAGKKSKIETLMSDPKTKAQLLNYLQSSSEIPSDKKLLELIKNSGVETFKYKANGEDYYTEYFIVDNKAYFFENEQLQASKSITLKNNGISINDRSGRYEAKIENGELVKTKYNEPPELESQNNYQVIVTDEIARAFNNHEGHDFSYRGHTDGVQDIGVTEYKIIDDVCYWYDYKTNEIKPSTIITINNTTGEICVRGEPQKIDEETGELVPKQFAEWKEAGEKPFKYRAMVDGQIEKYATTYIRSPQDGKYYYYESGEMKLSASINDNNIAYIQGFNEVENQLNQYNGDDRDKLDDFIYAYKHDVSDIGKNGVSPEKLENLNRIIEIAFRNYLDKVPESATKVEIISADTMKAINKKVIDIGNSEIQAMNNKLQELYHYLLSTWGSNPMSWPLDLRNEFCKLHEELEAWYNLKINSEIPAEELEETTKTLIEVVTTLNDIEFSMQVYLAQLAGHTDEEAEVIAQAKTEEIQQKRKDDAVGFFTINTEAQKYLDEMDLEMPAFDDFKKSIVDGLKAKDVWIVPEVNEKPIPLEDLNIILVSENISADEKADAILKYESAAAKVSEAIRQSAQVIREIIANQKEALQKNLDEDKELDEKNITAPMQNWLASMGIDTDIDPAVLRALIARLVNS